MSYLLDTNIISELVCPKPAKAVLGWFDDVPSEALHISVLTLGEIRKGIKQMGKSTRREKLRTWLDVAVADRWGRLAAQFERPVPSVVSLLAATALHHELCLVTRNVKDFNYPGLDVVNPWG
jgi:predicted nucleic acid-binding protein